MRPSPISLPPTLLLLLLALCAAEVLAQGNVWVGMTPVPYQPSNISLFLLNKDGTRGRDISTLTLSENERVAVDSFRCRPYGSFCLLTSFDGVDSYLYNISAGSGKILFRTQLPGVEIHNLHVDLASGTAYTVALKKGSAVVTKVLDGTVTPVVDISTYVALGGEIAPGSTTQCSDVGVMWVGVRGSNGTEQDRIVQVDLFQGKIAGHIDVKGSLVASMWASCNDQTKVNALGGVAPVSNGFVAYGTISNDGSFHISTSANIPTHTPPLAISGLLSEPIGYDYFFALYPEGTQPDMPVGGYLVFGDFHSLRSLKLQPIDYYLTGAARLS